MLTHRFYHTLDPKGRLIIPSKYREDIGEKFIVTRGHDRCLYLYPMAEWKLEEDKLSLLDIEDGKARKIRRNAIQNAAECILDKQNRFVLPSDLREFARIDKEVVFAGNIKFAEIWDKESFDTYNADVLED